MNHPCPLTQPFKSSHNHLQSIQQAILTCLNHDNTNEHSRTFETALLDFFEVVKDCKERNVFSHQVDETLYRKQFQLCSWDEQKRILFDHEKKLANRYESIISCFSLDQREHIERRFWDEYLNSVCFESDYFQDFILQKTQIKEPIDLLTLQNSKNNTEGGLFQLCSANDINKHSLLQLNQYLEQYLSFCAIDLDFSKLNLTKSSHVCSILKQIRKTNILLLKKFQSDTSERDTNQIIFNEMSNISCLSLTECPFTMFTPKHIQALYHATPKLKYLSLNNCGLSQYFLQMDTFKTFFSRIEALHIWQEEIHKLSPQSLSMLLSPFQHLKSLSIKHSLFFVTNTELSRFFESIPPLEYLSIHENYFSNWSPESLKVIFSKCTSLKYLQLICDTPSALNEAQIDAIFGHLKNIQKITLSWPPPKYLFENYPHFVNITTDKGEYR